MSGHGHSKDKQYAAIVAGAAVVTFFAVYWFSEIQAVREMLKMAYG